MSFSIGINGSKSKSKTSQTTITDRTTTPVIPDWIYSYSQDKLKQIQDIGAVDPSKLVAPADALQRRAGQAASSLGPSPLWDEAAGATRGAVQSSGPAAYGAESLLSGLDGYLNPYLKNVVDTSLSDYDIGADRTRAQQNLDLAGPWAGSNAAITRALTEGELNRGRGSLSANFYKSGYDTAAGLSNLDASRRQEAGRDNAAAANNFTTQRLAAGAQLADIAGGQGADARADIDLQGQLGDKFRGMDAEQRQAALTLLSWQIGQADQLPLELFAGQHTYGTDNTVGKSSGTTFGFDAGVKGKFPGPAAGASLDGADTATI